MKTQIEYIIYNANDIRQCEVCEKPIAAGSDYNADEYNSHKKHLTCKRVEL